METSPCYECVETHFPSAQFTEKTNFYDGSKTCESIHAHLFQSIFSVYDKQLNRREKQ